MNYNILDEALIYLNNDITPLELSPAYYNLRYIDTIAEDHKTIVKNPVVNIPGSNKLYRARSEMIIIKDDMVYINYDRTEKISSYKAAIGYNIPGGGWEPGEEHYIVAQREAEEEVRIKTKDIQYAGCYAVEYEEPFEWVRNNVPEKNWWLGYYTEVFVGKYDGEFKGKIADIDRDSMIKTGKFVSIKSIFKKLNPVHQRAITIYMNSNN